MIVSTKTCRSALRFDRETLTPGQRTALALLTWAHGISQTGRQSPWDYAVELHAFVREGVSYTELRVLLAHGLVVHGQETTGLRARRRTFRRSRALTFTLCSCFTISDTGIVLATEGGLAPVKPRIQDFLPAGRDDSTGPRIDWDRERRELWLDGLVVKRFRGPQTDQELILCAFQEQNWIHRIDDPLPRGQVRNAKRRLRDRIAKLNRHQIHPLIRFHGDGTGQGITWEPLRRRASARQQERQHQRQHERQHRAR
jgi:hypothetical protein